MRRTTRERRQPERLSYTAADTIEGEHQAPSAAGTPSVSDSDDEAVVEEPAATSSSDSGAGADASDDELDGEAAKEAGRRGPRKRPRVEANGQDALALDKAAETVTSTNQAGPASSGSGRTHSVPVSGGEGEGPQASPRSRAVRARKLRKRPARPPAADAAIGQAAPCTGVRKPLRAYEPAKLQAAAGAAALQPRPCRRPAARRAASCSLPSGGLFCLLTQALVSSSTHQPRPLAFGCARCPAVCRL